MSKTILTDIIRAAHIVPIITEGVAMSISERLRNLRAGPVQRAGGPGLSDVSIRKWIATDGLRLADRDSRESGQPRYDLADAARLFMLDQLFRRLRMAPASAVPIVNAAWGHFLTIAEHELAAMDDTSKPSTAPRYVLSFLDADGRTDPIIRLHDSPEAQANRNSARGLWLEVTMDLREIVREARNRLVNELGLSTSGLRHDFADAPEPFAGAG